MEKFNKLKFIAVLTIMFFTAKFSYGQAFIDTSATVANSALLFHTFSASSPVGINITNTSANATAVSRLSLISNNSTHQVSLMRCNANHFAPTWRDNGVLFA